MGFKAVVDFMPQRLAAMILSTLALLFRRQHSNIATYWCEGRFFRTVSQTNPISSIQWISYSRAAHGLFTTRINGSFHEVGGIDATQIRSLYYRDTMDPSTHSSFYLFWNFFSDFPRFKADKSLYYRIYDHHDTLTKNFAINKKYFNYKNDIPFKSKTSTVYSVHYPVKACQISVQSFFY